MDPVELETYKAMARTRDEVRALPSYVDEMPLTVNDHAMWRAAERFPHFDVALIESEVREAIKAGRVSHDRRAAGLSAGWASEHDRFCWTEDGQRVYAVRLHRDRVRVYTTMRRQP